MYIGILIFINKISLRKTYPDERSKTVRKVRIRDPPRSCSGINAEFFRPDGDVNRRTKERCISEEGIKCTNRQDSKFPAINAIERAQYLNFGQFKGSLGSGEGTGNSACPR